MRPDPDHLGVALVLDIPPERYPPIVVLLGAHDLHGLLDSVLP